MFDLLRASAAIDEDVDDEEFYTNIDAPMFVDLSAPDHDRGTLDEPSWFCLRIGCDQNHEQVDPEALHKNFVMRVMAARSPNVRLHKRLTRLDHRSLIPKCPQSVPAKLPRSMISMLSRVTGEAEKAANPRSRNHPIAELSAALTPIRAPQAANASESKTARQKTNKERVLSTKKLEQRGKAAVPSKSTAPKSLKPVQTVCATNTRKLNSDRPMREVPSRYLSHVSGLKSTRVAVQGSETDSGKTSQVSGNAVFAAVKRKQWDPSATVSAKGVMTKREKNLRPKRRADKSDDKENSGPANRAGVDHSAGESEENKENVNQSDKGKPSEDVSRHIIVKNSKAESRGKQPLCATVSKIIQAHNTTAATAACQVNSEHGRHLKRTTNPKPFRLRTNERGILREANIEQRRKLSGEEKGGSNATARNKKNQTQQLDEPKKIPRSVGTVRTERKGAESHQN